MTCRHHPDGICVTPPQQTQRANSSTTALNTDAHDNTGNTQSTQAQLSAGDAADGYHPDRSTSDTTTTTAPSSAAQNTSAAICAQQHNTVHEYATHKHNEAHVLGDDVTQGVGDNPQKAGHSRPARRKLYFSPDLLGRAWGGPAMVTIASESPPVRPKKRRDAGVSVAVTLGGHSPGWCSVTGRGERGFGCFAQSAVERERACQTVKPPSSRLAAVDADEADRLDLDRPEARGVVDFNDGRLVAAWTGDGCARGAGHGYVLGDGADAGCSAGVKVSEQVAA